MLKPLELLNLKNLGNKQSDIRIQSRVFHDRDLVFQSKETGVNIATLSSTGSYLYNDAIELGANLLPGDYVLQIVVIDQAAKKMNVTTQYVQFEVIE